MGKFSLLLLLLLVIPQVVALEGSLPLLAVSETEQGLRGALAKLELDIIEGKGRVFLETKPVTKIDTQISMRFAQQIACDRARVDCSEFDFIYTITAESGIVGGPSAGAAATALTYGLLTGEELRKDIALTGTINSGGIIGAVGGLTEKIEVGSEHFKTILIPLGTRFTEANNQTVDLVKYGAQFGLVVHEVADIDEVTLALTGVKPKEVPKLVVDKEYTKLMGEVGTSLCERSEQLREAFYEEQIADFNETLLIIENRTDYLYERGKESIIEGDYYAAASFCFRTNVNYGFLRYRFGEASELEKETRLKLLGHGIKEFRKGVDEQEIKTITQLQSSIVVLDRLTEAEEYLERARETEEDNSYLLSFATERLHSATAWSKFYSLPGAEYDVKEAQLAEGCSRKIQEAQERYQYVQFYIPNSIGSVKEKIHTAMELEEEKEYAFCLFTASQAKAEANVFC